MLRLLGVKLGRDVLLMTTFMSEFDLTEIGDNSAINPGVPLQTHLFEDRVMKMSYVRVGPDCTIGERSVVLYDSEMKAGARLGNLSLLMKGETPRRVAIGKVHQHSQCNELKPFCLRRPNRRDIW